MTTKEIAMRLVEMNRANDHETVYKELYSPEAESIENWDGTSRTYKGMEEISKKATDWFSNVIEIHETLCSEPLIADNSFAVTFYMDISYKEGGRQKMTELAVYTVADGKIIKEEFRG
jgi:hypothetical protein